MLKFLKIAILSLISILAVLAIILGGMLLWHRHIKFYSTEISRDFYALVDSSKKERLDMRSFREGEWDQLQILYPYDRICDYGIDGYPKDLPACEATSSDGESHLLFLSKNKLVGQVPIDRQKIDLTTIYPAKRIDRDRAEFIFESKEQFPKMHVANPACRIPVADDQDSSPPSVAGTVSEKRKGEILVSANGQTLKVRVAHIRPQNIFSQYGGMIKIDEIKIGDAIQAWTSDCLPSKSSFIDADTVIVRK